MHRERKLATGCPVYASLSAAHHRMTQRLAPCCTACADRAVAAWPQRPARAPGRPGWPRCRASGTRRPAGAAAAPAAPRPAARPRSTARGRGGPRRTCARRRPRFGQRVRTRSPDVCARHPEPVADRRLRHTASSDASRWADALVCSGGGGGQAPAAGTCGAAR